MESTTHSSSTCFESITATIPAPLRSILVGKALEIRFSGKVRYWQSPDRHGEALAVNLGDGELCLRLPAHLDSGEHVYLLLDCLTHRGVPLALKGIVDWCNRDAGETCSIAIVRILADF